jgi:hypothetical protein
MKRTQPKSREGSEAALRRQNIKNSKQSAPLTAFNYAGQWKTVLNKNKTADVEVVATVTEDAVNEFLKEHFKYDASLYTYSVSKVFTVQGVDRTFKASITAKAPLSITFSPFASSGHQQEIYEKPGSWNHVPTSRNASLLKSARQLGVRIDTPPANVRVSCADLRFHLEWPKLDNSPPPWSFDPSPFSIVADASVSLTNEDDHAGNYFYITFDLIQVKFTPTAVLPGVSQEFNDLLTVALNVVGLEYAPRLTQTLKVPVPVISKIPIIPNVLDVSNRVATIGVTVDHLAIMRNNRQKLQSTVSAYESLLARDVENAGGIEKLIFRQESPVGKLQYASRKEIQASLPLSQAFLAELKARGKISRQATGRFLNATVPDGIGIGVNEYLLTRIANNALPEPIDKNTPEVNLGLVKGWIEYWVDLTQATVTISGTTVSGSLSINVGGAIWGCVFDPVAFPPKWACSDLSLSLDGRPAVSLTLVAGNGVAFSAKITTPPSVDTDAPWPFSVVLKALVETIVDGLIVVINALLANVEFDVVPPKLTIPNQKTEIQLSGFNPFGFVRDNPQKTFPSDHCKFIGYSVGLSAIGS